MQPRSERAARFDLTEALGLVRDAMSCGSLDEVVALVGERHPTAAALDPTHLAARSLTWLQRDEEEKDLAFLTRIYEDMMAAERGHDSTAAFLRGVAQRYLEATAFLLPLLHGVAASCLRVARRHGLRSIAFFMRDAICAYPCFDALRSEWDPAARFVLYTRAQERAGKLPEVVEHAGQRTFRACEPLLKSSLLFDAGLYGSLISSLIGRQLCEPKPHVVFMSSRNPAILGWLNVEIEAARLGGEDVDGVCVVRLLDTIESLFKPFRLPLEVSANQPADLEIAEPVTLACALALLWAAGRYSSRGVAAAWLPAARAASRTRGAWLLPTATPQWSNAARFLTEWQHGELPPSGDSR